MGLYEITFLAEVNIVVEANSPEEAVRKGKTSFRWTDVSLGDAYDIVNLSGDDDDEEE